MANDQEAGDHQENTSFLGRLKAEVSEALFTDDQPKKPKVVSERPQPVPATQATVAPAVEGAQTVSKEDRANAVKILFAQVFTDKSAYLDYRDTFDALEGTVVPDENRRKAALVVVSKKYGIDAVAQALNAHKTKLIQERSVFEASLSPKAGGSIDTIEKNVQSNEQLIQSKRKDIEKLQNDIVALMKENTALQDKIAVERAKHQHARMVFELAYQELEQSIQSDEALITSNTPKGA
jgi:hypothetical protein